MVSIEEWSACADGGACKSKDSAGREKLPVEVTLEEAKAYANWLSAKTAKTYRLISEAEWERIMRAGNNDDVLVGLDDGRAAHAFGQQSMGYKRRWPGMGRGLLERQHARQFRATDGRAQRVTARDASCAAATTTKYQRCGLRIGRQRCMTPKALASGW